MVKSVMSICPLVFWMVAVPVPVVLLAAPISRVPPLVLLTTEPSVRLRVDAEIATFPGPVLDRVLAPELAIVTVVKLVVCPVAGATFRTAADCMATVDTVSVPPCCCSVLVPEFGCRVAIVTGPCDTTVLPPPAIVTVGRATAVLSWFVIVKVLPPVATVPDSVREPAPDCLVKLALLFKVMPEAVRPPPP